jgi:hypothetical protein
MSRSRRFAPGKRVRIIDAEHKHYLHYAIVLSPEEAKKRKRSLQLPLAKGTVAVGLEVLRRGTLLLSLDQVELVGDGGDLQEELSPAVLRGSEAEPSPPVLRAMDSSPFQPTQHVCILPECKVVGVVITAERARQLGADVPAQPQPGFSWVEIGPPWFPFEQPVAVSLPDNRLKPV